MLCANIASLGTWIARTPLREGSGRHTCCRRHIRFRRSSSGVPARSMQSSSASKVIFPINGALIVGQPTAVGARSGPVCQAGATRFRLANRSAFGREAARRSGPIGDHGTVGYGFRMRYPLIAAHSGVIQAARQRLHILPPLRAPFGILPLRLAAVLVQLRRSTECALDYQEPLNAALRDRYATRKAGPPIPLSTDSPRAAERIIPRLRPHRRPCLQWRIDQNPRLERTGDYGTIATHRDISEFRTKRRHATDAATGKQVRK